MEILVAILIIALIAAVAFVVIQRRPGGTHLGRTRSSPIGRRDRGVPHGDPMAEAVADHAEAMDPQDVVAAEERMRAQARQVAAGMHAEAQRSEHERASATDPAYGDPRSDDDGRLGPDVDARRDDRRR